MATLINSVILVGRIARDMELRKTNSDIPVCNFTIAVDRPGTNRDNRITDFIDCVAWRGTAEFLCKYFRKGDPVGIVGILTTGEYTDKDGNKRRKVEVLVDNVSFLPSKKQQETEPQQSQEIPVPVADPDNLPF